MISFTLAKFREFSMISFLDIRRCGQYLLELGKFCYRFKQVSILGRTVLVLKLKDYFLKAKLVQRQA